MAEPRPRNSRLLPLCLLRKRLARTGVRASAHGLLQLNSGGKATGARAESEGVAHVFDFPTRPRCVVVHVIVSDAVKGSHIQRSPLSMGGLCELGAVACSRHKKNIEMSSRRKAVRHSVPWFSINRPPLLRPRFLHAYHGYIALDEHTHDINIDHAIDI